MLLALTAVVMVATSLMQETDTLLIVRPDARVEVENFGGEIVVSTWSRNEVHVQAEHSSRERVGIRASASQVRIEGESRRGPARAIEYRITVPVGVDLELSGVHTDVSVEGTRGAISVETVQGDVRVQGGSGVISLRSVEGDVTLSGAEGRIDVSSVNEDVRVTDVSGDLTAETVNGDLVLDQVESGDVDASTVNGDVEYTGTIRDGGRYSIATHNGDITVAIPEGSNVTVSVASFSGDFESAFPVQLTETRRKRFTFVLGSGKARMELESFSGTIALERPGSRRSRNRNRHR